MITTQEGNPFYKNVADGVKRPLLVQEKDIVLLPGGEFAIIPLQ